MKPDDYKREYQEFSAKASDVARQLAFAGVAAAWFFRSECRGDDQGADQVLLSCALFSGALLCDILHYVVAAVIYRLLFLYFEAKAKKPGYGNKEFEHSTLYPSIVSFFFLAKILLVIAGYATLACGVLPHLINS